MKNELSTDQIRALLDEIYQSDSRRALATLIRLLGDTVSGMMQMHSKSNPGKLF